MDWKRATRLGTMGSMLALSACMMPYGEGLYEAPPPPVYSAVESPDEYRFIDRADSLWEAIGDAPPDHAFAFEGAEPWAWELQDGYRIVVEEAGEGIRSYYFAPGDEGPFLAVRPGMSFGFDGETVAVVYGPDGGAMPREAGAEHLGEGVELYARGRMLQRAMLQRQWRAVDSQAWIDTSPVLWGSVQIWGGGWRRHPGWERHRERWRDADWRHRIEAERLRRRALAEAFRRWREGGFQGPPPGRFHRPGEGHGPGAGRPHRPGQPGAGTPGTPGAEGPRQPGRGRPGGWGAGRPPRPDAGQQVPRVPRGPRRPPMVEPTDTSGVTPDVPSSSPAPGAQPTPVTRPRPGWGGRRPRPGRDDIGQPDASGTPTPPQVRTPESRPSRWTRPEGGRAGWRRPPTEPGETPATRPAPRRAWSAETPSSSPAPRRNWSADTPRPQRSAPSGASSPQPAPRTAPPPRPSNPTPPASVKARIERGEKAD
ncbi:MAG: hypothetical protein MT490_17130 [Sphingomonas sp.]|uniref:hypothetical protein n=1 Tax=Sphingomonas sp. TaxID=28214 RepID=UPI002276A01C|nr:hypothetical protein [Sphingomonas sp.]MCX8477515.1 hypothetical protein [Sphingomonas sp.]